MSSAVQRYYLVPAMAHTVARMAEDAHGEWVAYDAYAAERDALTAELTRVQEERDAQFQRAEKNGIDWEKQVHRTQEAQCGRDDAYAELDAERTAHAETRRQLEEATKALDEWAPRGASDTTPLATRIEQEGADFHMLCDHLSKVYRLREALGAVILDAALEPDYEMRDSDGRFITKAVLLQAHAALSSDGEQTQENRP